MKNKISVIIPYYRNYKYINRAILVINQTQNFKFYDDISRRFKKIKFKI